MKVLHIITRLILGGAQENTILSCEGLKRRGHEVTLAYGPIYGPEGSLLERAKRGGYELVELPAMVREVAPVTDWRCYRQCRELIRRVRPDVVHTHSSKAGIVGRAAAWAEGVPAVVHTVHGLPWHAEQAWPVRRVYIGLERWAAKRCHGLVGITQAMVDEFQREGIGRAGQFTVIPSGIELDAFKLAPGTREAVRQELNIPPTAAVIGIVARIDPLKGHEDLLEGAPAPGIMQTFPDLRILFVGDGWHRSKIEAMVDRLGLRDRVIFTGLVPHEKVGRYLSAMDVMALPSYQEGQGRTPLEAYLCGCGVVGYDSGGIGEVCIDGRTGRLVPRGDRRALARAIGWMLEHPDERTAMTAAGAELCRQRFDAAKMVDDLDALYRRLTH